ncbi:MAG: S41 family peptidase [Acidobacteriota bacterium]
MKNRLGLLLLAIVIGASIFGGLIGTQVNADTDPMDVRGTLLKNFSETLAVIESEYVEEISSENLIESGIRGMLRTLDPHSSFFSHSDYDKLQEQQKGKYYGLGISIRAEAPGSGRVLVVEPPAHGTPAYKAGLRAGDIIAQIEGESIDEWDIDEAVIPHLKGPKGTIVNITVERPGENEPLYFAVERDEIPIYTIKYAFRITSDIGYIRIAKFAETTGDELDGALEELEEETLLGLILDLRDNPGGSLDQALRVSDCFLDKEQVIVKTRSRTGKGDRNYRADEEQKYRYPMIVLINQNSASASEIVAGALQDHDRALIMGKTSFGKALVQTVFPLEGRRGLALTTGKYYTPSGRLIQRDYSSSFWDYYNNRGEKEAPFDNGEEFFTDSGRGVYGGGGITPDQFVELDRMPEATRRLQRKNLFRIFASKLYSGEIKTDLAKFPDAKEYDDISPQLKTEILEKISITDNTLERFIEFAGESEKIEVLPEELAAENLVIRNYLLQEILMIVAGDEKSYQSFLDIDNQVQEALQRIPAAKNLLAMLDNERGKL